MLTFWLFFSPGIANGCFFNLGARLARYTDNKTYSDWAEKTWDWMQKIGFMDGEYNIYDGAHVETDCKDINRAQFSYNNAVFLQGAAFMYNYVRTQLLTATPFPPSLPFRVARGACCVS